MNLIEISNSVNIYAPHSVCNWQHRFREERSKVKVTGAKRYFEFAELCYLQVQSLA